MGAAGARTLATAGARVRSRTRLHPPADRKLDLVQEGVADLRHRRLRVRLVENPVQDLADLLRHRLVTRFPWLDKPEAPPLDVGEAIVVDGVARFLEADGRWLDLEPRPGRAGDRVADPFWFLEALTASRLVVDLGREEAGHHLSARLTGPTGQAVDAHIWLDPQGRVARAAWSARRRARRRLRPRDERRLWHELELWDLDQPVEVALPAAGRPDPVRSVVLELLRLWRRRRRGRA